LLQYQPSLGRLTVDVSRPHTIKDTYTPRRTPLNEWSARGRSRYLHNTNIHVLTRNWTGDPSNKAASTYSLHRTDIHEGQSHENLKYVLARNLLNTKGTQW